MTEQPKSTEIFAVHVDIGIIDAIVAQHGKDPQAVIAILSAIQERYNYLPEEALNRVCETTHITPQKIIGVASFYSQFRLKPAGRHTVKVCIGTACHVKGAETVYNAFRRFLGITDGEDTDKEKLFTVQKVACLGCCMLAPAVQIDDLTYGFLSTEKVPAVLSDFLKNQSMATEAKPQTHSESFYYKGEIRMCTCSSCEAAGAGKVYGELVQQIATQQLPVNLKSVACTGISYLAPLLEISTGPGQSAPKVRYGKVTPQAIRRILNRHFPPLRFFKRISHSLQDLTEKLLINQEQDTPVRYLIDFADNTNSLYRGQQKHIVTQYCGEIDPLDLKAYEEHDGFKAFARCLKSLTRKQIIDCVRQSGLRGRGGGGFATGLKWEIAAHEKTTPKYLICNGDEGDPGAFMDRMILESFPFRVIEGIAIAAYALEVSQAFIYIRREYPLAIKRMEQALQFCRANGLLGEHIVDSAFSLQISIIQGAGAFVCGEETALISAIQGERGTPQYKPPYPAEQGLWGKPTVVNNVETLATVPWILLHGPEEFHTLGTASSKGTKTFALAGKIRHGGLIEVPMGITLREIVYRIGGGIQNNNKFKSVQIGGPSGGCVPAQALDISIDFDELCQVGAIMGSGGLIVLDDTDCMVDMARYFMQFTQSESCGKCTSCRIGTKRMLEILERICLGQGTDRDVDELEHLARVIKKGSLCGLGKTAPNPVLSTLKYFMPEYQAHIKGECPAKSCKALITYSISDDCIGCTRCAQNCPVEAIASTPHKKHTINPLVCIRCDTCRLVCPSDAIRIQPAKPVVYDGSTPLLDR
ncbi:MAG: NAD(P)H-dependent oxidoreductase subunit E [Spirochaetales bacterium]|nr:NAD(P)H-dependent oxidoreductase subunit E [Spirochaetales bacterium]